MAKLILLCDDEMPILRAVEFKLKRAGFATRLAQDGETAWQAIQDRVPDLIFSDYQMPRLDGLGLAQRVRSNPRTSHVPFILLTGKGFELNGEEVQQRYGVTQVLPKPFSPREILDRAIAILGLPDEAVMQETPV